MRSEGAVALCFPVTGCVGHLRKPPSHIVFSCRFAYSAFKSRSDGYRVRFCVRL